MKFAKMATTTRKRKTASPASESFAFFIRAHASCIGVRALRADGSETSAESGRTAAASALIGDDSCAQRSSFARPLGRSREFDPWVEQSVDEIGNEIADHDQ